ncbi:MAG TPA: NAD(P)H-dependent oxidoreductase subunit E, partial [Caulifigura sp.]|nr:NAD(P)H-dependent oxidoreductase subunit E [Caulifigura sp.]
MPVLSEQIRERIRAEFPKYPDRRAVTLPALHIVHDELRQVSPEAIREISELLEIHPAEIHDTMSFYNFFREPDRPLGKRRVWVCRSLSCMLRGGEELLENLSHKWHVGPGQ